MPSNKITVRLKEKVSLSLDGRTRETYNAKKKITSNSNRSKRVLQHLVEAGKASYVGSEQDSEKQGKVSKSKENKATKGPKETKVGKGPKKGSE